MKLKSITRILITLTALVLTVCMITSCGIVNIIANYVVTGLAQSSAKDFESITYVRPDFEKIHNCFDDFLTDLKAGKTGLGLQITLSEAYTLFNDAQTQYSVVQINYYNDVNDETAKEETEICAEEFAKLQTKLTEVYAAIVEYDQAATFLPNWTEREFENLAIQKKLFDDEYVEIQKEIAKIQTEYMDLQKNVKFRYPENAYRDYTIDAVIASFEKGQIDQNQYKQLVIKYYEALAKESAPLYIQLVKYNNRIAEKAGFNSYQEYANRMEYSRDYTVEDIKTLYQLVKKNIPTMYDEIIGNRAAYNPMPKADYNYYSAKNLFPEYFSSISPEMKKAYNFMERYHLSSIGNAEGMQQAGFTTYLPSYEMPYIYLYDTGTAQTTFSFVHEFGHFFAYYQNGFESDGIIDVSEIHSQTNELLFLTYLHNNNKMAKNTLFDFTIHKIADMYQTILEGCLMDEFQSKIHENIDSIETDADINSLFKDLANEYDFKQFYSGLPYQTLWAAISHNFVAPFYYISYAVSAIPALEIYRISLEDYDKARSVYLDVLDETGYRPYLKVLADNGLTSPFTEETFATLQTIKNVIYNEKFPNSSPAMKIRPYHFLGLAA